MPFLGPDGNDLPLDYRVNNIPWLSHIGFVARVNTQIGSQLRRPTYGVDLSEFIGRGLDNIPQLRAYLLNSLSDIEGVTDVNIRLVGGDLSIDVVTED